MAKCKLCPHKKVCRDACYGDDPCSFALAFDGLARKLKRKDDRIKSLEAENKQLNERLDTLTDPNF